MRAVPHITPPLRREAHIASNPEDEPEAEGAADTPQDEEDDDCKSAHAAAARLDDDDEDAAAMAAMDCSEGMLRERSTTDSSETRCAAPPGPGEVTLVW